MSALSPILRDWSDGKRQGLLFYCPGCRSGHSIRTNPDGWGWNGCAEKPTFTPSVLVTYNGADAGVEDAPPAVCHSFVTDGKIRFLDDSTHALAGQTVALPEWPASHGGGE